MIKQIPQENLHNLFLAEMKKRKSNSAYLKSYHKELRQFCLSINLNKAQYNILHEKLNNLINI